jgi:hypothetical protein
MPKADSVAKILKLWKVRFEVLSPGTRIKGKL